MKHCLPHYIVTPFIFFSVYWFLASILYIPQSPFQYKTPAEQQSLWILQTSLSILHEWNVHTSLEYGKEWPFPIFNTASLATYFIPSPLIISLVVLCASILFDLYIMKNFNFQLMSQNHHLGLIPVIYSYNSKHHQLSNICHSPYSILLSLFIYLVL